MFLLHLKDFNVLMDVMDLTDFVDLIDLDDVMVFKYFKVLPLFLGYQVVARLYLLSCINHIRDVKQECIRIINI